ncbi:MAG: hypothetical protein QHH13_05150 [Melioribacter sp.]|uniref:hypothetical protein n=1 Tax=Rosettibacter primus TaxID=3111523 RepID=UPI00247DC03A|nr:hypothetical protein [Melioribacter sp.]
MNERIPDLIRKILTNTANHNDLIEFDKQITKMVGNFIQSKNEYYDDILNDIKQNVIENLWTSFTKNSFWQERLSVNEDNDRVIISYVYSIINSCYNSEKKSIFTEEERNLKPAIRDAINKLINDNYINKIEKFGQEYYSINTDSEKMLYDKYTQIRNFYILRRKSSEGFGKINYQAVYLAVKEILENLENYYLSLSDIIEILMDNSDVRKYTVLSLGNCERDEEIDRYSDVNNFHIINEEKLNTEDSLLPNPIDCSKFIDDCNKKIDYYFQNKKKADYSKICFYLYYKADFTYAEISEYLLQKFHKKLSIQTVKNYIDDLIVILNFGEDYDVESEEFKNAIEKFMSFIANEYNLLDE